MSFTLPELPYAYDALQPYMSRETLEFHHDKHHAAYVNTGNNLLKGSELEGKSVEEVVKGSFGKNQPLFNNAGQHYNHIHFWQWMKPNGGGTIPGKLEKQIAADLGGVDKFKEDFIQAGVDQFGSGWAWLAVKDGKLAIMKTPNGENPLVHGAKPILGVRRVGALLLHRLPQPAPRLPQGLHREPRELGARRGDVRVRDRVTDRAAARPARVSRPLQHRRGMLRRVRRSGTPDRRHRRAAGRAWFSSSGPALRAGPSGRSRRLEEFLETVRGKEGQLGGPAPDGGVERDAVRRPR